MAQIITIDLKKNPSVADAVSGRQPGDNVDLKTTIKTLDEQTLQLRVVEAIAETDEDVPSVDEEEDEDAQPA